MTLPALPGLGAALRLLRDVPREAGAYAAATDAELLATVEAIAQPRDCCTPTVLSPRARSPSARGPSSGLPVSRAGRARARPRNCSPPRCASPAGRQPPRSASAG